MADLPAQKLIVFDTDPGIDDAMALLFLRSRADARLLAITTAFGNADVGTTTRNAEYLVARFGIDAPVHRGAGTPLRIARRPAPVHVHGADGLGDSGAVAALPPDDRDGDAAEQIVRLIRAHPGRVSLLAVAPLTNLARALEIDPAIADLTREVVVMGGAFGWAGRRGNVSPVAEANIANDPDAADRVFGARWPVTVVGLDVTTQSVLPATTARALAEDGCEAGRFLWDISRHYEALYREHDGLEGFCLHDVAAAACLLEPQLFEKVSGPIRVVTDGIAAGQTIQRPDRDTFPPSAWDGVPSQRSCRAVNVPLLLATYLAAIRTPEAIGCAAPAC